MIISYCCLLRSLTSFRVRSTCIIQQSTFHREEVIIHLSKYWLKVLRESNDHILKYMCNLEELNQIPLYFKK